MPGENFSHSPNRNRDIRVEGRTPSGVMSIYVVVVVTVYNKGKKEMENKKSSLICKENK